MDLGSDLIPDANPYTNDQKFAIADIIWGVRNPDRDVECIAKLGHFFEWLHEILLTMDPNQHIMTSYGDLSLMLELLDLYQEVRKTDLWDFVGPVFLLQIPIDPHDLERLENSIVLAIYISTGLRLGRAGLNALAGGEDWLKWGNDMSLRNVFDREFHKPGDEVFRFNSPGVVGTLTKEDQEESIHDLAFSSLFTLRDMERLAGFHIEWTSDLSKHLLVQRYLDRKFRVTVNIYHPLTLLQQFPTREFIGSELVQETRETLGLLIPTDLLESREWFDDISSGRIRFKEILWSKVLGQNDHEHGFRDWIRGEEAARPPQAVAGQENPPSRKVSRYQFWRARLLLLDREFTDAEPRNLRSWLHDRRKRKDWYTFWVSILAALVAIIALLLGGASTATGIYSAWAAKQSLNLANSGNNPPIVVCCNSTATGGAYTSSDPGFTPSSTISLFTAIVYTTITTFVTVTVAVTTTIT